MANIKSVRLGLFLPCVFLFLFLLVGVSFASDGWNSVSILGRLKLMFMDTVDFNNQSLININSLCLGGVCNSIWPAGDNGSSSVEITAQTGITSSPNPITDIATIEFDTAWGDARYIVNQSYDNPTFINVLNWSKVVNITITSANLVTGIFSSITGIGIQTQNLNLGTYSLFNATNVNATRFNGKLDCTNIDGGSDGDYCTDATGASSGSPSQWLNSSTLVYLNSSYPQTLNITTLNVTRINLNGSQVINDIVAGAPITVTGSATNKTIDITLPSCTGSQVLTVTDGNTFTCTTPPGGSSAPWEGVLHSNIGDGNPNDFVVLSTLHNTVESVAGPTPTGIGSTVGRLQNFKYKTAITINNISYYGLGTVANIYTIAIYNSTGAILWWTTANTTATTWTTIRISPAVTIPANTQMWFGISATTTGTTAGFRTPVSPIASSLGLTTTPARLTENSIIYRQVALTAGAWPATLPSLSAAAFASAGATGTIPIMFFQSN